MTEEVGRLLVDFVGRYETLARAAGNVFALLGRTSNPGRLIRRFGAWGPLGANGANEDKLNVGK